MTRAIARLRARAGGDRARLAVAAVAGPLLLLACNMVTGADNLRIGDDESSSGAVATGGAGLTGSSGGAIGGGSQAGGNGSSSSTSSGTGAGSTSSGQGGTSSSGSSSSSSGSGAGPTGCDYPAGPYGVTVGATVSPSLSWQGYAEGPAASVTTIAMADYFDCDGTKGINALMVDTSQYG